MEPEGKLITVEVNGTKYSRVVEPRLLLVQFIRENLRLTGTHIGCDTTNCGCCTVLISISGKWKAIKSCTMFAVQADNKKVITIEGLGRNGELHPIQKAFRDFHALQCGYCTPGMIMSSLGFLFMNPDPTENELRKGISGNLCTCTGYQNIIRAVLDISKQMKRKQISELLPSY